MTSPSPIMHKDNCAFCRLALDQDYTGVRWIRDSPGIMNFKPLNPVTRGHRLFAPMIHVEHNAVHSRIVAAAFQVAYEHGTMKNGRLGEDFNLIISSGDSATQTIPHVHVHYVPRRPDDNLTLPWTGQKK